MKLQGLHFVDVAVIQAAVTDALIKEVQKEEFSADFQKLHDCEKACIYIYIYIYIYTQGVQGGMCETSGECSLC